MHATLWCWSTIATRAAGSPGSQRRGPCAICVRRKTETFSPGISRLCRKRAYHVALCTQPGPALSDVRSGTGESTVPPPIGSRDPRTQKVGHRVQGRAHPYRTKIWRSGETSKKRGPERERLTTPLRRGSLANGAAIQASNSLFSTGRPVWKPLARPPVAAEPALRRPCASLL